MPHHHHHHHDHHHDDSDHGTRNALHKMEGFMKKGLDWGREELDHGFEKGKAALQSSLGLGHRPNVVPPGPVDISGPPRKVEVGWHPVAGLAGKWFAEQTGVGRMITEEVRRCPDPTQHWAVLVGDYVHQLWMDEHLDVIYINERVDRAQWHTFEVGRTRFNDEALRNAGEMTIARMRERRPAYNLIDNNCQTFALALLDAVRVGKHREFATSFAVWKQVTDDPRKLQDLFAEGDPTEQHPEDDREEEEEEERRRQQQQQQHGEGAVPAAPVSLAHKLMDENTPRLNVDHPLVEHERRE